VTLYRQLVLCRVTGRVYGIELGRVREIIPFRRATRLPGAGAQVAGLVNVRGTIVTVLDLAVRLASEAERTDGAGRMGRTEGSIVLIEHGSKLVGAAVDEVLDVRREADVELGTEAETLVPGGAVRAVGRLDGEVVALLDIRDIIAQVLV
jgi:purine-binding chemotaxis protein CheW